MSAGKSISKDELKSREILSLLLPGDFNTAGETAAKMLKAGKKVPAAFFAAAYQELIRNNEAKAQDLFRRIRFSAIRDAYAAYQMGVFDQHNAELGRAEKFYLQALKLEDGFWEAEYNLANLYRDIQHHERALEFYKKALQANPDFADALFNAGLTSEHCGLYDQAIDYYKRALELDHKGRAEVYCRIASTHALKGESEEAERYWQLVESEYPDEPVYYAGKGFSLLKGEESIDKVKSFILGALERGIEHPKVFFLLIVCYLREDDDDKALEVLNTALEKFPQDISLWEVMLDFYTKRVCYNEAVDIGEELLALNVDSTEIRFFLAMAYYHVGRSPDAERIFKYLREKNPNDMRVATGYLGLLPYSRSAGMEDIYQTHVQVAEVFAIGKEPLDIKPISERKEPKLRIGFVSGDFKDHAAGRYLFPKYFNRDRDRFEFYSYAHITKDDDVTDKFRNLSDKWTDITYMSDLEVAKTVRDDEVDILVDYSGHSAYNRLAVFPYRAAPLQVTTIGSNLTTGLRSIDYCFVYNGSVVPGSEKYFSEKVKNINYNMHTGIEGGVLHSKSNNIVLPKPPRIQKGYTTYACYSRMEKIEPELLEAMVEILRRSENTILRLMNLSFRDEKTLNKAKDFFISRGVDEKRLQFIPPLPMPLYFDSMASVDMALLSFPFAGGTVATDFLSMGVPFVSRHDEKLIQSRDGYSVLGMYGLQDTLAVTSYEDYIDTALRYGQDNDFLTQFRATVNSLPRDYDMMTKPFCEGLEEIWLENGGQLPWR